MKLTIPPDHPNWAPLIKGELNCEFKLVAASMMFSRFKRDYKSDPTPEKLKKFIADAQAFFTKYETLLENEIKTIFK